MVTLINQDSAEVFSYAAFLEIHPGQGLNHGDGDGTDVFLASPNNSRFNTKPVLDSFHCLVQQLSRVNQNQGIGVEPGYRRQKNVRLPASGRCLQYSGGIPE